MADYDLYGGKPPHVEGSDTSEAAAEKIVESAGTLQARVFAFLKQSGPHGCTDEFLQKNLKLKAQTETARRRELVLKGLVVDSGTKRTVSSGRSATVWVLCDDPVPKPVCKSTLAQLLHLAREEVEDLKREIQRLQTELWEALSL